MERKFKTKDQKKIEKLTAKLSETEAELSKVKKDRKRLNYAVERLERENQRLLNKKSSTLTLPMPTTQAERTNSEHIQLTPTKEEYKKYGLKMSWVEGKAPEWIIQKMEQAIQGACLTKIGERDFDNFHDIEKTNCYLYEGTKREFDVVKRFITSINELLLPLKERYFNLAVYGGEISDFEIANFNNSH